MNVRRYTGWRASGVTLPVYVIAILGFGCKRPSYVGPMAKQHSASFRRFVLNAIAAGVFCKESRSLSADLRANLLFHRSQGQQRYATYNCQEPV